MEWDGNFKKELELGEEASPVNRFTIVFNCGLMSTFIRVKTVTILQELYESDYSDDCNGPCTPAHSYVKNLWSSFTATEEWPEDDYFAFLSVG